MEVQEEPVPRTVLTIDDEEGVRAFIVAVLTGCGYRVLEADSGERGLAILRDQRVDVVLLDVNMDGLDGREVARRMRADPHTRDIPVVMLTGSTLTDDAVAGLEAGADEFLGKPIPLRELVARVRALVRRRELEQELVRLEQERMEARLAFAREIQQQLLPRVAGPLPGLDVAVRYRPCDTLGGDFYDWFLPADDRSHLVLGDAEGHGVGAALWMATARAYVRAGLRAREASPGLLLRDVNGLICADRGHSALLPLLCVRFDVAEGRIRFANAGHEAPLVVHADGSVTHLESNGPILGMMAEGEFEEGEVRFGPGDVLVAFTDGLTEAFDAELRQFGRERVLGIAAEGRGLEAGPQADRVVEAWAAWVQDRVRDDLTLIVARRPRP